MAIFGRNIGNIGIYRNTMQEVTWIFPLLTNKVLGEYCIIHENQGLCLQKLLTKGPTALVCMSQVSSVARRRPGGTTGPGFACRAGQVEDPTFGVTFGVDRPWRGREGGNDGEWEVCRRMIYV